MRVTSQSFRRMLALALMPLAFAAAWLEVPVARADGTAGSSLSTASPGPPTIMQTVGGLPGIDVSHYQDLIDWTQVAASGVRFAIAKATEGRTFNDPLYATNKAGAETAGIAFTAYHFAQPDDTSQDAIKEADHFVDVAQLGPGNLIPALDIERTGNLTQAQLTQWILDWLGRVTERTGVRPMVYTSPNGWKNRTGDTTAVADAGYTVLWVAHWDVSAPTVPAANWGGNGWTFWQYSNCGAVPGIAGCVDLDTYNGTSLDAVTIASPDTTPPTVTIAPPRALDGPAVVSFSEVVHDVTPGNVLLWRPDAAAPVPATLSCRSGGGVQVDCLVGSVRTVSLQPERPLVAGESYTVWVNPVGVLPAVVDRSGNVATEIQQAFTTPSDVEQDEGALYAWGSGTSRHAYGRSYATEHLAGAGYAFEFRGRSVTWYTATGPAQGRAQVFVDGRSKGVFDQYAPTTTFKVARRVKGLARGWHTIVVEARGTHASAATDSQVVVDAFGFGDDLVRNPSGVQTWRRARVANASGGTVAVSDVRHASASFAFRGTGVDWYTAVGPAQGRASVYVDGALVRTVDNFAAAPAANIARSVTGLADGVHTLRIVVLGQSRPKARGAYVTVDRLVAIP